MLEPSHRPGPSEPDSPEPKPPEAQASRVEPDYVGAPTEYADAEEVPEWVETAAKVLFFLPAAMVTATTIPLILFGGLFMCIFLCALMVAAL